MIVILIGRALHVLMLFIEQQEGHLVYKQEAPLSPMDHRMRRVN